MSRGSSSCSSAADRRAGISAVARRCAVETRPSWLDARSAIVGSRPSSTTSGSTFHASSTAASEPSSRRPSRGRGSSSASRRASRSPPCRSSRGRCSRPGRAPRPGPVAGPRDRPGGPCRCGGRAAARRTGRPGGCARGTARAAATTCRPGARSRVATHDQTSAPSASCSRTRARASRCHQRSGSPVRPSASRDLVAVATDRERMRAGHDPRPAASAGTAVARRATARAPSRIVRAPASDRRRARSILARRGPILAGPRAHRAERGRWSGRLADEDLSRPLSRSQKKRLGRR